MQFITTDGVMLDTVKEHFCTLDIKLLSFHLSNTRIHQLMPLMTSSARLLPDNNIYAFLSLEIPVRLLARLHFHL